MGPAKEPAGSSCCRAEYGGPEEAMEGRPEAVGAGVCGERIGRVKPEAGTAAEKELTSDRVEMPVSYGKVSK